MNNDLERLLIAEFVLRAKISVNDFNFRAGGKEHAVNISTDGWRQKEVLDTENLICFYKHETLELIGTPYLLCRRVTCYADQDKTTSVFRTVDNIAVYKKVDDTMILIDNYH